MKVQKYVKIIAEMMVMERLMAKHVELTKEGGHH
jgi:hypothetical protein